MSLCSAMIACEANESGRQVLSRGCSARVDPGRQPNMRGPSHRLKPMKQDLSGRPVFPQDRPHLLHGCKGRLHGQNGRLVCLGQLVGLAANSVHLGDGLFERLELRPARARACTMRVACAEAVHTPTQDATHPMLRPAEASGAATPCAFIALAMTRASPCDCECHGCNTDVRDAANARRALGSPVTCCVWDPCRVWWLFS